MIPLRAYYQLRFNPEARGCALALNNVFQQIMIVLIDTVLCMFCANFMPTLQESGRMPDFLMKIAAYVPSISAQNLIISLGIATLLVTLLTMWMLPDFCLRFIVITLSHTVYRIRKIGTENIPSRGPVMLISNHISIVDAILIGSCTSRRVRFLLDEEYFSVPMISLLVRLTGFIKVPSAGAKKEVTAMYETVKEALRKGEIVCVFPEGWMSHNGVLRRFKGGYEKMIPPEIDVPLIPVYIGQMWGSMFSYYKLSRRKLHFPRRFPFFVSLTFGTPMKKGIRPFEVRQKIAELSAEQAMIPLPFERTIHYHLARYAKQAPFRIAMRDADGHEEYSYFRTFREAVLLSMSIRRMTPSSVKYVGILLPNSTDAALSIFSVLIADKTPCPLNYSTSQEIFELSVKKAGITHIITTRKFLQGSRLTQTPEMIFLEDLKQEITRFGRVMMSLGIILCPYRELINILAPLTKSNFSATAVLLFSSGSTGNPKGVMLSHHNMYTDAVAIAKGCDLKRTDKIAGNLPLFHSYGVNVCFWMPFLYG